MLDETCHNLKTHKHNKNHFKLAYNVTKTFFFVMSGLTTPAIYSNPLHFDRLSTRKLFLFDQTLGQLYHLWWCGFLSSATTTRTKLLEKYKLDWQYLWKVLNADGHPFRLDLSVAQQLISRKSTIHAKQSSETPFQSQLPNLINWVHKSFSDNETNCTKTITAFKLQNATIKI